MALEFHVNQFTAKTVHGRYFIDFIVDTYRACFVHGPTGAMLCDSIVDGCSLPEAFLACERHHAALAATAGEVERAIEEGAEIATPGIADARAAPRSQGGDKILCVYGDVEVVRCH